MTKLFIIIDNFKNNTNSKELFIKRILENEYYTFESFGEKNVTTLLRGRSEIPILVALLNVTDNEISLTSTYDNTIKILIILTLFLALTCVLFFLSSFIFCFNINKDIKAILLVHPIVTLVMFILSRIALYIKKTELIEALKKSKLIKT